MMPNKDDFKRKRRSIHVLSSMAKQIKIRSEIKDVSLSHETTMALDQIILGRNLLDTKKPFLLCQEVFRQARKEIQDGGSMLSRMTKIILKNSVETFLNNDKPNEQIYRQVMEDVEPLVIKSVMDHCGGNKSKASALLGINRGTLNKKIDYYGDILDD